MCCLVSHVFAPDQNSKRWQWGGWYAFFQRGPILGAIIRRNPLLGNQKKNTRFIMRDLRLFCEVTRNRFFRHPRLRLFNASFNALASRCFYRHLNVCHWKRKGSQLVDYSVFKTNNQPGLLTIIGRRRSIDTSKCPDDFRSAHKRYELAWDEMLDQFLSNPKSVEDEFFEPKKLKVLCLKNRRTECILYWLIFCVLSIRGHHE